MSLVINERIISFFNMPILSSHELTKCRFLKHS